MAEINPSEVERCGFTRQLEIDPNRLDEVVAQQAVIFQEIADRYVMAVSVRDASKDAIKIAEARADVNIRSETPDTGLKITEGYVKGRVEVDKLVIAAKQRHAELCLEADRWQALKESFQQRRYMISDLCFLYNSGYFIPSAIGAPKSVVAEKLRERDEKQTDENRKKMNEQRQKRVRLDD